MNNKTFFVFHTRTQKRQIKISFTICLYKAERILLHSHLIIAEIKSSYNTERILNKLSLNDLLGVKT